MKTFEEIKMNFIKAEGLYRLMFVNIIIFLIVGIFKVVAFLTGNDNNLLEIVIDLLAMKASLPAFISQPWSLITYMFVHENFLHILFNMLVLFWTGKIFCEFMGSSRLVVVYFLGGIVGALLYAFAYNMFPVFSNSLEFSKLIGASAGVIAILVALATLLPNYEVHLLFFGAVRLKYLALFLILLYIINIPDGNAGGNIAHLGGALLGFTYIRLYKSGTDIGKWLEYIFASVQKLTRPPDKFKVIHRNTARTNTSGQKTNQDTIDAILDKISRSGYASLTNAEKEILFNASKTKE
jgi:membrane associated rhomboid family serine protease